MFKLQQKFDLQWLALASLLCLLLGLLFSRAMMSIGMIVLLGTALFNRNISQNARQFIRDPVMLGITGIFFLYLLSGLNSSDHEFWIDRLRMKLPFLVLPFAFVSFPRFSRRLYFSLLLAFFWIVTAMALYSLVLFLMDWESMTYLYREGRVMPTPVMHIRFSLMVAFCVAIAWYLYREGFFIWHEGERYVMLGAALFLVFYLHILAVRSGLLALYGVAIYFFLYEVLGKRRYRMGLLTGMVFVFSLWISYQFIPTLRNKLGYTFYSIELFRQNKNLEQLSDSYRLGSIYAGLALASEHSFTGVGIGDIKYESDVFFRVKYPALAGLGLLPHNQYILVLAATGIFGLLYFVWASSFPLYYRKAYRDPLFVAFHIIIFLSFLVEHTIETQLGTAFYILFLLMGLLYLDRNKPTEQLSTTTS